MHALIVEDDRLVARDYARLLRHHGARTVDLASGAESALMAADRTPPAVALVDITLQGNVTGLTLGELLADRGTAVIYISGRIDDAVLDARDHAIDILAKPLKELDLAAALATARARVPQTAV